MFLTSMQPNNKDVLCELVDPVTPSSRSQTLPADVRGLQSFQSLSSKSPSTVNVVCSRSHRGVTKFFSRTSLKSLGRFFVAGKDGSHSA